MNQTTGTALANELQDID